MRKTAGLALFFLLSASAGWACEPITIMHSGGTISTRSANKIIQVQVEKDSANRELVLTCESESLYRSSGVELEENSASVMRFEFNLSEGEYECVATLRRSTEDGKIAEFRDKANFVIY